MSHAPQQSREQRTTACAPAPTGSVVSPPVAPCPLAATGVGPSAVTAPGPSTPALVVRRLPARTVRSQSETLPAPLQDEQIEQLSRITTAWEEAARPTDGNPGVLRRTERAEQALSDMVFAVQLADAQSTPAPYVTLEDWIEGLRTRLDPQGAPEVWAPRDLTQVAPTLAATVTGGMPSDRDEFEKLVTAGGEVIRKARLKQLTRLETKGRDADRDAWYRDRYDSEQHALGRGAVKVNSWAKTGGSTSPPYRNTMTADSIRAEWNFRNTDDANVEEEKPRSPHKPPRPRKKTWALPNGELLLQQYRQAGFDPRNLTLISRVTVINTQTRKALDLVSTFDPGDVYRPDSPGFNALLSTPNCATIVWLLADHSIALDGAEIAEIHVNGTDIDLHLTRRALPQGSSPATDDQEP